MSALQIIWFLLIGVLLTGYAVLAGFDLGVGIWHMAARGRAERRMLLATIAPHWDGNQVWLLTGAGALFAAFPAVYATVFSGFYLAMMLLLMALILRVVAIEFRSRIDGPAWQKGWDVVFALGSIVSALLLGVAFGNIIRGVPLDAAGDYSGGFFGLLNPFSLLIGLNSVAMMAVHGALFLSLKTEGDLARRAAGWARAAWGPYLGLFLAGTIWNYAAHPYNLDNYRRFPPLLWFPLAVLAGMLLIPWLLRAGRRRGAFVASAVAIAGHVATAGFTIFPNLVPAANEPARSLTIANASSSPLTLTAMLVIAAIGIPIMLAYTTYVFRKFKGPVTKADLVY